jgi:endonuclease G
MKNNIIKGLLVGVVTCLSILSVMGLGPQASDNGQDLREIHCKHFILGIPLGTPGSNDLIFRDIYAMSTNDSTKFADWVAYRLDPETVVGEVTTKRLWKADPWLAEEETLEPEDNKGAHKALETDRGHQAPLASFKGTNWQETNYLSNIYPTEI